jgi:peptidoglycan hydrolase FlgJ
MFAARFLPVLSPAVRPLSQEGAKVLQASQSRETDAAKELEATFLSLLLKEMRQTLEPEGGLFPGDTGDVQGGLFDLYLGKHLADIGGVGMAASLERNLRNSYAPAPERGPVLPHGPVTRPSTG